MSLSTSVCRTTTLTLSTAPQVNSMRIENQNHVENPNPIVASPKTVTASNIARPAFCSGGR